MSEPSPIARDESTCSAPGRIDVRTDDTCEFIASVNTLFGPHRFLSLGADGLHGCIRGQRIGELSVGEATYGAPVQVLVEEPRDAWLMAHPVGADGAWDGQRFAVDELMMFSPQWCGRTQLHGQTWMRIVYVPQEALQQHLTDLLGTTPDGPIRFAPRLPIGAAAAERLRRLSNLLVDDEAGGFPRPAALERSWQTTFCMELLSLWPHAHSADLARTAPALPRAVRRAQEAIDVHLRRQPDQLLPVTALADLAGVGVRALELAFQKHLNVSPARYLRERRLDGARADLTAVSAAQRPRVVDTALKWGFSNPGQFARAYAQRFGELPGRRRRR